MTEVNDITQSKLNTTLDTDNPVAISDNVGLFSQDLKGYENTGYKIIVDVPSLQNSNWPLFFIDLLGYNPGPCNDLSPGYAWSKLMVNESMVQASSNALSYVKILKESKHCMSQIMYDTHRYVQGTPRFALKVSSSTNVSGNLFITQMSGVYKTYYTQTMKYTGLQPSNMSSTNYDHDKDSFMTVDLSLNRVIKINPLDRKITRSVDMALLKYLVMTNYDADDTYSAMAQYFPRDFIVVGQLSNLTVPGGTTGQVSFDVFADYSTVQFGEPILPLIPSLYDGNDKQILKWSETFNEKVVGTLIKDAEWLPSE